MFKKHKQNSLLKSYKNEIKIFAHPGLAQSGFEQPGPVLVFCYYLQLLKSSALKLTENNVCAI